MINKNRCQLLVKLKEIRRLMLAGYTNNEIIDALNIPERTFYRYMSKIHEQDKLEL